MQFLTTYEGFAAPSFYNSAEAYKQAGYVGKPQQEIKSNLAKADKNSVEKLKTAFA